VIISVEMTEIFLGDWGSVGRDGVHSLDGTAYAVFGDDGNNIPLHEQLEVPIEGAWGTSGIDVAISSVVISRPKRIWIMRIRTGCSIKSTFDSITKELPSSILRTWCR